MSVESVIYLNDGRLPTIANWQAVLDARDVGMLVEDVGDLRTHSGFLPVTYKGTLSGFEWYYGAIAKPVDGVDRTHMAVFVTHSNILELYCALVTGAVLAQMSDAYVLDDENELITVPDAWLRTADEVKKYLK